MMLSQRRVKIIATIGPSTHSYEALKNCIISGMNVARLNFSHGSHEDHKKVIANIRKASQELDAPVSILQDLQGPKIRVGEFENGEISIQKNEEVWLTTEKVIGKNGIIPVDFSSFINSCKPGQAILLDDGLLKLEVLEVVSPRVKAKVVYGGVLKNRKGINIPGGYLDVNCLTEKDLRDLELGLAEEVDYVALSFVRTGADITKLREIIDKVNPQTRIVAKIEMYEAVQNLRDIVEISDAVMVARGDLAIEVGQTLLPGIQKRIVKLCNEVGRPVITATQMLDSMVHNPRPTRAEITDVANAILDGTDALMLSAETATGKYPLDCIQTMHEIALEVEKDLPQYNSISMQGEFSSIAEGIGASACLSAMKLKATAIVCLTTTGKTATIISRFRPKARIIAMTHILSCLNRLEVAWGIQTLAINPYQSSDEAMDQVEKKLLELGLVKPGDQVILTLGTPVVEQAKTNTLQVCTIRDRQISKLPLDQLPLRCQDTSGL